jgi:hypothetical protein
VTLTTLALSMALSACDGGEGVRAATASRAADAPSPSSSRRLAPWDARAPVWPDEHCRRCTVAAAIRSRYAPAAGAAAPGVRPMRSPLPGGRAGVLRAQAQWET